MALPHSFPSSVLLPATYHSLGELLIVTGWRSVYFLLRLSPAELSSSHSKLMHHQLLYSCCCLPIHSHMENRKEHNLSYTLGKYLILTGWMVVIIFVRLPKDKLFDQCSRLTCKQDLIITFQLFTRIQLL